MASLIPLATTFSAKCSFIANWRDEQWLTPDTENTVKWFMKLSKCFLNVKSKNFSCRINWSSLNYLCHISILFPYYFYRKNISQSDYSIKKLFTGLNSFFIFVPKQHWFEIMTCVLIVTLSATNNQNISINKTIFCERQNIPKKKKTAIKLFWKARSHAWFCVSSDLYLAPTVCNHFYPFSNLDPLFWTTV